MMLVLSRKRGEQIVIGGAIVVTVVEIRGDKIRIGIDADKEIPVHRKEVEDLRKAQNALIRSSPVGAQAQGQQ